MDSTAKCQCLHCNSELEFDTEMAGKTIDCPVCYESTELFIPIARSESPIEITPNELLALFNGPMPQPRVSILYPFGLFIVAAMTVLLPAIYLALIGLVGYGAVQWGDYGSFLLSASQDLKYLILGIFLYAAPIVAGIIVIFFMIKPFFAEPPRSIQPVSMNPASEPLLFALLAKTCEAVGAPFPDRIEISGQLNASLSFGDGFKSLFSNRPVLTLGLPLVAGLTIGQFAGLLAHEFGYARQGVGRRLRFIIYGVNGWLTRMAYQRDSWDEKLADAEGIEGTGMTIVLLTARFGVWCSRLILKLLSFIGFSAGGFMCRQGDYDADAYAIQLTGSAATEASLRRLLVLDAIVEYCYQSVHDLWIQKQPLPNDLTAFILKVDANIPPNIKAELEDQLLKIPHRARDLHPSTSDRIRRAQALAEPGVFHCDLPAMQLFSDFSALSETVTLRYYIDDLGILPNELRIVSPESSQALQPNVQSVEGMTPDPDRPPLRWRFK